MTIERAAHRDDAGTIDRRTVLRTGLAVAALGGPFSGLVAGAHAKPRRRSKGLVPVRDKRDGAVRLHLPRGFNYRSFHHTARPVTLDDGTVLPPNHDGMGAFRDPDGGIILVRNHELNNPDPDSGEPYAAFGPLGGHTYDAKARGGTTTIHVDKHGRVKHAYTSLNGTMMNCSGGQMPWGAWVTCEETVNGPDVGPDFTGAPNAPLEQRHGYVFEVPIDRTSEGRPIRSAGRFAHEAVSFDPVGGHLYLTEDNFGFASGFYRYTPPAHPMEVGEMQDGGVLEMLKVVGQDNAPLHEGQPDGASYDVEWVEIDDPDFTGDYDPATGTRMTNDQAIVYVGDQGRAKGAAQFSRLEGQVYEDGVVYFCSTQGGPVVSDDPPSGFGDGQGQVWAYDTRTSTLSIVFESPGRDTLDLPDNVTTSADGTLVLCEDNDEDNFLRGLSRRGDIWDIALNQVPDMFDAEFAGSTFSPDGHTLFVNIQDDPAMSFAIWGPWKAIGV
jgi:secreted PhoX family phosphatase